MSEIKLLPDEVINKIAAGEVVERPSSVVKELVENSIDAGSTKITVELEEGGTKSIVISDNGKGIRKEDIPLTVCRHATSKIRSASDLFSIHTMGFRGEALAAISSVSRFKIKSRHFEEAEGSILSISNERELISPQILSYDGPKGTTIMVEDLFYNVPARSKFLKRSSTEYAHILELIQALSLVYPQIDFSLIHNSKEVFRAYPVNMDLGEGLNEKSLRERARAIFKEDAEKLIYAEDENEYGKIKALISPPGVDKATSKHIFSFVNGRWVKDKAVRSGIFRGYHGHLLKGRNPMGVIVLDHDPSLVDVNAHPAKTEVRFQYPGEVGALIALAIRSGIRQGGWAKSPEWSGQNLQEKPPEFIPPMPRHSTPNIDVSSHGTYKTPSMKGSSYSSSGFSEPRSAKSFSAPSSFPSSFKAPPETKRTVMSFSGATAGASEEEFSVRPYARDVIPWEELNFIGTFAKCYLLFEGPKEEFLAVDQHAFHERILFEMLTKDENLLLQAQPLMIPELVELSAQQVANLLEEKEKLAKMSFSFEAVSDSSVEIKKIPTLLAGKNLSELFAELSEKSWEETNAECNAEIMENILATIACHSAVRSGEILTGNELTQMLNQAKSVDFYHNCPHGRRVFRWFKKSEVAKWFDRI